MVLDWCCNWIPGHWIWAQGGRFAGGVRVLDSRTLDSGNRDGMLFRLRNAGSSKHSASAFSIPDGPETASPSMAAVSFFGHPCPKILGNGQNVKSFQHSSAVTAFRPGFLNPAALWLNLQQIPAGLQIPDKCHVFRSVPLPYTACR